MVVRELKDLPAGALREHWSELSSKEAAMSETIEMNAGTGTARAGLRGGYEPGSWKVALLAGLPHLLMACDLAVTTMTRASELVPSGESVSNAFAIAFAVVLMILTGVVLYFAKRRGWPRWTASWYFYAGMLVIIPLLGFLQLIYEPSLQHFMSILMFVVPVILAVLLYEVARRDRLKEVLIVLPILTFLWNALNEFVPPQVDVFLLLGGWFLTAAVAVVLVRLNNWRIGVWSFLGLNLLVGLSAAYTYVIRFGQIDEWPFGVSPVQIDCAFQHKFRFCWDIEIDRFRFDDLHWL